MLQPWDWQLIDQQTIAQNNWTGAAIIETGGAKTLFATLAAKNSGAEVVLIVAPQGTHRGHGDGYEWHIKELTGNDLHVLNNGTAAGRQAFSDIRFGIPGFYAVTPQMFARTDWHGIPIDMAIIDEHHLLTQGKKSRKALLGTHARPGLEATHRIVMSGTPTRNKFQNWWAALRWLYPDLDGYGEIADRSEMRWRDYNMTSEYDYFAYNHKKYLKEKVAGKLVSEIPCVIQHLRREKCCAFHPDGFLLFDEPNPVDVVVELLPEQKRAIKQLEQESITWLGENPLVSSLPITTQLRVRQFTLGVPSINDEGSVTFAPDCSSPKLDATLEILENLDEDDAAIVFTSSQKFAAVAVKRITDAGYPAFEWSGKVSGAQREDYMRRFQEGEYRVGVVVIAAGGTGVSGFQRRAATEIWLDRDLDETSNVQASARLDRIGQTKQVQRFMLFDSEGYDEDRFVKQLANRLELNRSNRRRVA